MMDIEGKGLLNNSASDYPQYALTYPWGTQSNSPVKHTILGANIDIATWTLFSPTSVAVLSLFIILVQTFSRLCSGWWMKHTKPEVVQTGLSSDTPQAESHAVDPTIPGRHVQPGDTWITAFKVVRVVCTLALLVLYFSNERPSSHASDADTWDLEVVCYVAYCLTYLYALALSIASLIFDSTTGTSAARHFNCVILTTWLVYAYRDLWPLATFTLEPLDRAQGHVLWVQIALLTINAILVPLLIPTRYVPFDPKDPWANPPPEQTASILSNLLFSWLDSTIWLASRVEHLSLDMLPPLADYDDAQNLMKRGMNELDPFCVETKGRHIMWGLLRIFRSDLVVMAIAVVSEAALEFVGPLSIKYILSYVETGGYDAVVRPWFWVVTLLLGSVLDYVISSVYIFRSSRMMVRIEAIITQLIFEHALRMRVKADVKDDPNQKHSASDLGAPATGSSSRPGPASQEVIDGRRDAADKGKHESTTQTVNNSPARGKNREKNANTAGRINNLITSDLASLSLCREFLSIMLRLPIKVIFSALFLYSILGWSALVGLSSIVVMVPVASTVVTLTRTWHIAKMKKTDARVQILTEAASVMRMIKLFGWEPRVATQLHAEREEELRLVKKRKILSLINNNLNHVIPMITMLVTYGVFTVVMKRELTASVVFSTMTVFSSFTSQLQSALGFTPTLIRAKVSLDRVNDFLQKTELLDTYSGTEDPTRHVTQSGQDEIRIRNASFTWTSSTDDTNALTPINSGQGRNFVLRIDSDLVFKKQCINLIIGPTGSGKTSLLMALLGEMHYIPTGPDSVCDLPRTGGVAYAAQESWVQNETIRDNILFGSSYDEDRYNKVIEQCALKRDLELFSAGDNTEVGERGITLSGGQKARVTLARAIYSRAQIVLLDDVFASVDVHTSRWIIEKCFRGDLVRGRTILLVTHNVSLASPLADFVVALDINGAISSRGSIARALESDKRLAAEVARDEAEVEKSEVIEDGSNLKEQTKLTSGKLIIGEEVAVGHVGQQAMGFYFNGLGGNHKFAFWSIFLGGFIVYEVLKILQTWWLGYWAQQYEKMPPSEVNALHFLGDYGFILTVSVVLHTMVHTFYILATLRASVLIHDALISSVLSVTWRWLDTTPVSRIVARCTQDIEAVDGAVPKWFGLIVEMTLQMIAEMGVVVTVSPAFILPSAVIAALGAWIGQLYMKAQLAVKRERSNAKAPVLGHFGAAFVGLTSIRAYGAQDMFKRQSYVRINQYTRASRTFFCVSRWVDIRVNALAAVYSAALATYLVYVKAANASDTGLSLYMAVSFSSMILSWVRVFNELELTGNSLERIRQYLEIDHEPKPTPEGTPPAYWPASGNLRIEKLSAWYSPDGPQVLHDISFEVKSGERIGIVGRTGAGKSSLTLALMRCILTEGDIYYDGLPTNSINLDALRSHITVIPQAPQLLSGTLRQNLDPFHQHDDAILNDALQSAGLFSLQKHMSTGKITLDTPIAGGGTNLSVGQRQIMALARALVRQSKLLILDEATSAIDYETDIVIQKALREDPGKDVTLLIIAHRLQTVMDADRIMVLDAGRIVEFGTPSDLLMVEGGMLRAMVDESTDKHILYDMAQSASNSQDVMH